MRSISETVLHAVYSPSAPDAHGNVVDGWATPTSVGVYGFDPGGSAEPLLPGQDRVVTTPTLYMPSTVAFGARDRVTVRGLLFEVDGETAVWRHPNGTQRGNVATLRRVTG
jgi:hypothetical protein